jgi:hypothetical protein
MKIRMLTATTPFLLAALPAMAQDLPTDQLERHADVVRQDSHLRSSLKHSMARQTGRATPRQAAACAKKAQFRKEHGAEHPKVQKLYDLCRSVGL